MQRIFRSSKPGTARLAAALICGIVALSAGGCGAPRIWSNLADARRRPAQVHILKLKLTGTEDLQELAKFTNLRVLELDGRELKVNTTGGFALPAPVFGLQHLENVRLLGVQSNLPEFSPETIKGLRELVIHYAESTNVAGAPPPILNLVNARKLHRLELEFNKQKVQMRGLGTLKNLRRFFFSGNGLTEFPPGLGEISKLEHLSITNMRGLSIAPGGITRQGALRSLNLRGNSLAELPGELGRLDKLVHLDVAQNKLSLPPRSLGRLNQLVSLDFARNQITELPRELARLKNLSDLELSGNLLTELPDNFHELRLVNHLRLKANRFSQVPAPVLRFTWVQSLDLSRNLITELPASIADLSSLRELRLGCNQIIALPAPLESLKALRILNLDWNRLRDFPFVLTRMPALRELSLTGNFMRTVPAAIGELTNLEYLGLSHNLIHELPSKMNRLTALKHLHLAANPLKFLPRGFDTLHALEVLELRGTRLRRYPAWLMELPRPPQIQVDRRIARLLRRRGRSKFRSRYAKQLIVETANSTGQSCNAPE